LSVQYKDTSGNPIGNYCTICTQGATLYFCARSINLGITQPWNGATVSVKYE
jgi:hypothetical protein